MKRLIPYFVTIFVSILILTSCSTNSEQPSSPNSDPNAQVSSKINQSTSVSSNQFGRLGTVGKLFGRDEANTLFGRAKNSVSISVDDLNDALKRGNDYIFFTVKDNQVVILNERRQHLSNDHEKLGPEETVYVYSKEMIQDLLNSSRSKRSFWGNSAVSTAADQVAVELRDGLLTLTYNDQTLEMGMGCPPWCNN